MWWIILIVVILGPIIVALIRTALIKDTPSGVLPDPPSDELIERTGHVLSEMVQSPTVSHVDGATDDIEPFLEFHQTLEKHFPNVHRMLKKEVVDHCNLMFHWQGRDPSIDPILLIAHQDVVPAAEEGWRHPPFSGTLRDGSVWGRGALDCKSTLYNVMEGVERLIADGFVPSSDVWLAFSSNEETSGDGAAKMSARFEERGIRFRLVLDEGGAIMEEALPGMDRPFAMIGVTEKGYIDLKITAKGTGGHSSTPPNDTPLVRLARFMDRVDRKKPFKKHLSKENKAMMRAVAPSLPFGMRFLFGNLWLTQPLVMFAMPKVSSYGEALMSTTIAFTMAEGSETSNVIPTEAWVMANMRPSPHQNVASSIGALQPYLDANDLEATPVLVREASPVSDIDDPRFEAFVSVIETCFPDCGIAPYLVMGGTDARNYTNVSDMVLRFQAIRMTHEELGSMHNIDERINIRAVAEGVLFIRALIERFC
ncbi:MAG: M20/M25/M40 family metallo-hydrolase [Saccharofermentanales bacterium]|jgi:carboxypeptidase PM20D1